MHECACALRATNLRKDLPLPHDQGVQTTSHTHQMLGSIPVLEQEQEGTHLLKGDAARPAHPVLHLPRYAAGS
eukprot:scaffold92395_cov17-Tisochrysis_lutea.AAC.1